MDINLVVINVGNSRLAIGSFIAGELEGVQRIPHADREACRAAITEAWAKIDGREFASVAGATVNPIASEPLERDVEKITGTKVQWVGREIDLPINVLTETPKETGVDRIVNIAAAFEQIEKACVVVDAGTAITVDVCNDKGEFLGGAIAPGLNMMLDAMHDKTARLPRIEFEPPAGSFGTSTKQAILHGVYGAMRGMVKELVEEYATALGFWPDVIATGGDAERLFGGWELIHAISPDLTLYGVGLAFTNHHIKHET